MEIVEAKDSNVPEIVEVWKEVWDFHKNLEPTHFIMSEKGPAEFDKYLRGLIKSDDAQVLIALDRGHVIAYSITQILKRPPVAKHVDYGFISDLGVKAEYRRKCLGGQILDKIFEWFRSHHIDRIELTVLAKNQIGYSFWKKHGFAVVAHRMFLSK